MLKEELALKDRIINKAIEEKQELIHDKERLSLKLRIPRAHLEFIKQNGKLEEFIEAKS